MTKRKILYGYRIQRGELAVQPQEAIVAKRIVTLYLEGLSYQKIAGTLNADGVPFSAENPLWNKHKVKRLLENPRYAGTDGYPAIIEGTDFQAIQRKITSKTKGCIKLDTRPALRVTEYLRCACGGSFHRTAGPSRRKDMLYLKCGSCGKQFKILDSDLLSQISTQMAERNSPTEKSYIPSGEVVRLTNAVNRGLEHPDHPEEIVTSILQGVSARYDCCPAPTESDTFNRPAEVDFKRFGQAVSYIAISDETIIVHFK